MAKHMIETVKAVMMEDGEERILLHLDNGIKQFLSPEDFLNIASNSALGIKDPAVEDVMFCVKGGVFEATFNDKHEGEMYTADPTSTIVTKGTHIDTVVVREGKKITIKAGEKALVGDSCPVIADGVRLDRNKPLNFEPNMNRLIMLKAQKTAVERMTQQLMTGLAL